jgi:hypothetical protein
VLEILEVTLVREDDQSVVLGNDFWGLGENPDRRYVLSDVQGLDAADSYEYTAIKNARSDGVSAGAAYISARTIILTVTCALADRQPLLRFLNPKLTGTARINYNGKEYRAGYRPERPGVDYTDTHGFVEIIVSLLCVSPFLLSPSTYVNNMALIYPMFMFPWGGLVAASGQSVSFRELSTRKNIVNNGDVETPLNVEFVASRGGVTNPCLVNHTTGVTLRVGTASHPLTMNKGDSVSVIAERGRKRVTLNNENVFMYLSKDSDFIQLAVGNNYLEYFADDGYANLDVNISRDYLYLGV